MYERFSFVFVLNCTMVTLLIDIRCNFIFAHKFVNTLLNFSVFPFVNA